LETFFLANLLVNVQETKPIIHQKQLDTNVEIKPDLVASYFLWPGNEESPIFLHS